MKNIDLKKLNKYREDFEKNHSRKVMQRAVTNNGIGAVSRNPEIVNKNRDIFSIEINAGEIDNQNHSGRCWMYAALVLLEKPIAKKLGIPKIKLSKNYLYFYDKLEMANSFYEHIIETRDLPITDNKVQYILRNPQYDGGFWHEAASLINKYGVVPDVIMPEVADTKYSDTLNEILNEKLRADVLEIRNLKNVGKIKEEKMAEVYQILATILGTPPTEFTYEFIGKNKKGLDKSVKRVSTSPLEFFKKYGVKVDDFHNFDFILNHKATEWNKYYEEELSDPMYGNNYKSVITKVGDEIKKSMIKQLKAGEPIWFWWSCDKQFSGKTGVLDANLFDYQSVIDLNWKIDDDKKGLLRDSSTALHATAIIGVDIIDGKPTKWKVKNSWGTKLGKNGYIVMNDNYLDKYVLGVTLREKYLPTELKKLTKTEPVKIQYWA